MAFAVGAGMVFNLGNMLLIGGISVSGMALVFLSGARSGTFAGAVINCEVNPQADPLILFSGELSCWRQSFLAGAAYIRSSSPSG
jgi:hypothetical protein